MRVGCDLLCIQPGRNRGVDTYVRRLLPELAGLCELVLFVSSGNQEYFSSFANAEIVRCPLSGRNRFWRVFYEQFRLPALVAARNCDLLFCPGYLSPIYSSLPVVAAIHDAQFRDIARMLPPAQRLAYQLILPRSSRAARSIITASAFSRTRLIEVLKLSPAKVFVVPYGCGLTAAQEDTALPADRLAQFGIASPYILCVSSSLKHKNLARLMEAYCQFEALHKTAPALVLAGVTASELPPAARCAGVTALGFVGDADLELLYSQAYAVVIPSLYEGFGFPVLEAMSRGVPVASSNAGSLPEVTGGAAVLFDPSSASNIAAALKSICFDKTRREELIAAGRINVARFDWRRCAQETAQIFSSALAPLRQAGGGI